MAVVYHWKHGWIPLDHTAALSKAKGNHDRAAKLLADAHGAHAGIHSRQDVAKAIRDLPNVPSSDRNQARHHIAEAANLHNATDLLPAGLKANAARVSVRASDSAVSALFSRSRMTPQQERAHVRSVDAQLAAGRLATAHDASTADAHGITDQMRGMTDAELEVAAKRSPIPAFKRGAQAELARRRSAGANEAKPVEQMTDKELHQAVLAGAMALSGADIHVAERRGHMTSEQASAAMKKAGRARSLGKAASDEIRRRVSHPKTA